MKIFGFVLVLASLLGAEPALAHHVMGGQTPLNFAEGLLSGLAHPVIGFDHLAAVIAIGCLAAGQPRGALLVVGYVLAMIIGAAAHIGEATVAGADIFVGLSVIALGLFLLRARPVRLDVAIALFAFAGLLHGYALGESIAGAEAAPLNGYFIGLALIQSALALAAMTAARMLAARTTVRPAAIRVVGIAVIVIGVVVLVQQILSAA